MPDPNTHTAAKLAAVAVLSCCTHCSNRSNFTSDQVELSGLEPLTSCMPSHGSTSTRVHTRRLPSSRIPVRPPGSAPVAVLSCCTAAIPAGSPSRAPDKALTSANPAHQVTGAPSGAHAVKAATEARPHHSPSNFTPQLRGDCNFKGSVAHPVVTEPLERYPPGGRAAWPGAEILLHG
jgi:hypothetical protein